MFNIYIMRQLTGHTIISHHWHWNRAFNCFSFTLTFHPIHFLQQIWMQTKKYASFVKGITWHREICTWPACVHEREWMALYVCWVSVLACPDTDTVMLFCCFETMCVEKSVEAAKEFRISVMRSLYFVTSFLWYCHTVVTGLGFQEPMRFKVQYVNQYVSIFFCALMCILRINFAK